MIAHYYESIPGWFDFQDIYAEMVQKAPRRAVFVEVGNCFGKSLAFLGVEIVNSGKDILLYSVDHANVFRVPKGCTEAEHMKALPWDGFTIPAILEKNMRPCTEAGLRRCHVMGPSDYPFAPADFVFLDACHDYDGIKREIAAWWPHVNPGGYLGGHDHTDEYPGVVRAVREAFHGKATVRKNSFLLQKPA